MRAPPSPPLVLGSSLSGLLVSLRLSKAGIEHVVVGGPEPAAVPRLGESMIETTGPELWQLLGRTARAHFYEKSHISLFDGDHVSLIHMGNPRERLARVARLVVGRGAVRTPLFRTQLFHVDRAHVVPLLYPAVRAQRTCRFLEERVTDIAVDRHDGITAVTLRKGRVLERPRVVFDATGPRSVVGEALGVAKVPMSAPHRVAWRRPTRGQRRSRSCGTRTRDASGRSARTGCSWVRRISRSGFPPRRASGRARPPPRTRPASSTTRARPGCGTSRWPRACAEPTRTGRRWSATAGTT